MRGKSSSGMSRAGAGARIPPPLLLLLILSPSPAAAASSKALEAHLRKGETTNPHESSPVRCLHVKTVPPLACNPRCLAAWSSRLAVMRASIVSALSPDLLACIHACVCARVPVRSLVNGGRGKHKDRLTPSSQACFTTLQTRIFKPRLTCSFRNCP